MQRSQLRQPVSGGGKVAIRFSQISVDTFIA